MENILLTVYDKQEPKSGHTISDWLTLHNVTALNVVDILDMKPRLNFGDQNQEPCGNGWKSIIPVARGWTLVSNALSNAFSVNRNIISEVEAEVRIFELPNSEPLSRPYTLDHGVSAYPGIYLNYKGNASGLIDVAHEFGHALQLVARKRHFLAPSIREIAAFVSELVFIAHLKEQSDPAYGPVVAEWGRQNAHYLGADLKNLSNSILFPVKSYNYRHNYPPARILATLLFHAVGEQELWSVFEGEWSLMDCVDVVKQSPIQ